MLPHTLPTLCVPLTTPAAPGPMPWSWSNRLCTQPCPPPAWAYSEESRGSGADGVVSASQPPGPGWCPPAESPAVGPRRPWRGALPGPAAAQPSESGPGKSGVVRVSQASLLRSSGPPASCPQCYSRSFSECCAQWLPHTSWMLSCREMNGAQGLGIRPAEVPDPARPTPSVSSPAPGVLVWDRTQVFWQGSIRCCTISWTVTITPLAEALVWELGSLPWWPL